ncbi:hypothetical protein Hanom_Chr13g01209341 [Helianthus anomalus]
MRWVYIVDERREDFTNLSSISSFLSSIQIFFKSSTIPQQIFKFLRVVRSSYSSVSMAGEETQIEEGTLKWDQGLVEQITRGFRFPPEWDAQYPSQGQTAADAPPGYITLFEDYFLQGNFRLLATEFIAHILHYYGFHLSQMSPPGMVRVRHFKFLCRSHGIEPTFEKFRVFYKLIRNIRFYSFGNKGFC